MPIRSIFLFVFSFFLLSNVHAQYQRKGVPPVMRGPSTQAASNGVPYTIAQLQGKWQEYKRTDYTENTIAFTDTSQLNFWDKDSAETQSSGHTHFRMLGVAEIDDDNTLMVAGDPYTVRSINKNEMVLDDQENLHWFKKVDNFFIGESVVSNDDKDEFSGPIKPSLSSIMGNWSVYKRDVKPGMVNDKTWLIRYLNITSKVGENVANATVTVYTREYTDSSTSVQKTATVTLNGTNIKIITDTNTWDLPVYEADENNLVFGTKSFRYYCKPNGK